MNLNQVTMITDDIEILEPPYDARYLWQVSGPSGNRICLYHGSEARLNPLWRVN